VPARRSRGHASPSRKRSEHVALALREVAELLRCFGRVIDGYRHLLHG
jgi:hypothetical protein